MKECEIYNFCQDGCNSCSYMGGDISRVNLYFCENVKGVFYHIERFIDSIKEYNYKDIVKKFNPEFAEIAKEYFILKDNI